MSVIDIKDLQICIIEPSKTQAKIMDSVLKELEVQNITIFNDGIEAINNLEYYVPDLVISAMYLPDMTGTDVVLTMRDNETLENIPFMLISSETSFSMLEPIRQAGVVAILPKPFKTHDLKKALYSTVDYINPSDADFLDINIEELSVLIVDDSHLARKHIIRILNSIGIEQVDQARGGKEAINKIANQYYDLIFTDYNMPEIDGEELTRYIREQSTQASIPVIMVTSEGNEQRLLAVQQAGVSAICDKPFEILSVKKLIKNVLVTN